MKADMQPSLTAEGVAFARAIGSHEADARLRNPDYLAQHMLGPSYRFMATVPGIRFLARLNYERVIPGIYLYHIARTRHIDDLFVSAIKSGVKQFVILGAGMDTRAYRFAERLSEAKVFEVDHPGTAAVKRQRLHRIVSRVPEHVVYVPVDFERDSLAERLRDNGIDLAQKTFFLWEGVSMYLTKEAIDATLSFVSSAAPGSTLTFDYYFASVLARPGRYFGGAEVFRQVEILGEPYTFGLDPEDVAGFLSPHRMRLVSNTTGEDFVNSYASAVGESRLNRMIEFWGVAHCEVLPPAR